MCYRNANYCQIEIGKLKTLWRKRTVITTGKFIRTLVADEGYLLSNFVSFSMKKNNKKIFLHKKAL